MLKHLVDHNRLDAKLWQVGRDTNVRDERLSLHKGRYAEKEVHRRTVTSGRGRVERAVTMAIQQSDWGQPLLGGSRMDFSQGSGTHSDLLVWLSWSAVTMK
eukprot:4666071-Prymnesium_polylepis.1